MRFAFDVLFFGFSLFENQVVKDHNWFQEKPSAITLFLNFEGMFFFCFGLCVNLG
jgi:hypothetical protein